jgi:hypothetical protein
LEAYRRLVTLRKKLIEKARQDYDTLAKNANSDSRVSVSVYVCKLELTVFRNIYNFMIECPVYREWQLNVQ